MPSRSKRKINAHRISDHLPLAKNKTVNKSISLALLLSGIILIIYGVSAADSIGSSFSRFFTGSPTDETIWLLIWGLVALIMGAAGLLRNPKAP